MKFNWKLDPGPALCDILALVALATVWTALWAAVVLPLATNAERATPAPRVVATSSVKPHCAARTPTDSWLPDAVRSKGVCQQ